MKYCQNKSTNACLFRFPKVNCQFTAELRDISRKWRIAWFKAVKFKNTNVSIDSIDDCRIWESNFKSGKRLNAVLVFYKALHFILSHQEGKFLGEPTHCLKTTSGDWIPSIDVSLDDVKDSLMATHNRHKVIIPSRFLKKRKLFQDVVCILRYYSIFIYLST